ncbi:toxin-antitoxin system HicB family antitoxin [Actinomadura rudentiformis]|uniref:Toxin-antitoxin system HicB family antitoxin n=1 Tax=Actinomadura rudentiformis TaxID=359158 RepID=A0A6H9YYA0_9ACTN|nr:toxin-antitoxin system HicB family antitoxin [Actinomadura rudentiformis]KAB2350129.1 toxin-antitoxin system HicB family antitoxin [Actinomadura rudentiformis]
MDLMPYVENLRRELAVAAEAGGPEARALAERLTGALESAARLTLLEALSAAADEITRDLAPGSVDVRLRGGDPAFVVTPPEPGPPSGGAAGGGGETAWDAVSPPGAAHAAPHVAPPHAGSAPAAPSAAEEGGTARMTLRLPEHLKLRVEEAAGRQGISVNAWLVRAISAAFESGAGSRPADRPQQSQSGRSYTGWVR